MTYDKLVSVFNLSLTHDVSFYTLAYYVGVSFTMFQWHLFARSSFVRNVEVQTMLYVSCGIVVLPKTIDDYEMRMV